MSGLDVLALAPLLILGAFSIAILLACAFFPSHRTAAVLALAAFALAAASLPFVAALGPRHVTPLLVIDGYGCFYAGLILVAAFAVAAMSYGYLEDRDVKREEYYVLLVVATLGALLLVASTHFASFFLGLEVLSVSLYGLVGYLVLNERGIEAAIKYLVLAAASAAFLVFGMALVYAEIGTMDLDTIARSPASGVLFSSGLALILVGVGFKLAVAPFHMWTADVYEGAPAPVTAFVATISKGAMFGLLMRYFLPILRDGGEGIPMAFAVLAVLSMLIGNLLALFQDNVKRILAYSSIAHLGYLLVAFLAGGDDAARAVTYYMAAYFATTLAAFAVVTVLSGGGRDADSLDDYRGLYARRPWTAAVLTAALLSLAGMPMTAGFVGKFFLVQAGVGSSLWALVLVLVAASAIGLYYYLRVVVVLFLAPAPEAAEKDRAAFVTFSWAEKLVLGGLAAAVLWLGLFPGPLVDLIWATVKGLTP